VGEWYAAFRFGGVPERDLNGRTVGCIGAGHIGSRVVQLARALGMRTIAITRTPTAERAARLGVDWLGGLEDLHRLLRESDFAVVCVPLSETTTGLLGAAELELLGSDGFLVNVARGPVVQQEPLYEALRTNGIAGAGLDVWYSYPAHVGQIVCPPSPRSGSWTTSS
jgi:phosphoglycerate dehydrogenase-like enzyme